MNKQMKLAKTCSTCVFSRFGRTQWGGNQKKQMGICTVDCSRKEPKTKVGRSSVLYTYAVEHGEMLDFQTWIADFIAVQTKRKEDHLTFLRKEAASGQNFKTEYRYKRNRDGELNGIYRSSGAYEEDEKPLTQEAYKAIYQELAEQYETWIRSSSFCDWLEKAIAEEAIHWWEFKENFEWWQENKMKMKRCHRNTTCGAWEENKRAEPVARSIVKGKYELEWKKEND